MISAYSKAYQTLRQSEYLQAAIHSANFIRKHLYKEKEGLLIRNFREGPSQILGFADDYSFLIAGLLDLYEASFDLQWLNWAHSLQQKQNELFWDQKNFGYYNVQEGDKSLLLRMKEDYDGAEPSNNSVSALNLLRLSIFFGNSAFRETAQKIFLPFQNILQQSPVVMPLMCSGVDFYLHSPPVIVIVGSFESDNTQTILQEIYRTFLPHKTIILLDEKSRDFFSKNLEYVRGMKQIQESTPTIYVCENFTCQLPVTSSSELINLLKKCGGIRKEE